jgi:GGDEF domain-containing protein
MRFAHFLLLTISLVSLEIVSVSSEGVWNKSRQPPPLTFADAVPTGGHYRDISVEDLKRSEKYLRKDLGLESHPSHPSEPLWKRSIEDHPFLVSMSALMFGGGILALILVMRNQNRKLKEGLILARENDARLGGSYGGRNHVPVPIQEIISKEAEEIKNLPALSIEKIPRKVDSVLDSLRSALGAGSSNSRTSLYRFDEGTKQFRMCGFSIGESFQSGNSLLTPPKEIFSSPLRALSRFPETGTQETFSMNRWFYPFVIDSGELCVLILEMNERQPPDNWSEFIKASIHLLKALIARQVGSSEDVTLNTHDESGSLDYRATLNRMLAEWDKSKKIGIPFSVIALRIDNMNDLRRFYGIAPMDIAWNRLASLLKSNLRQTDWLMRPERDLLLLQLVEAGHAEGQAVQKRLAGILEDSVRFKTIDRSMKYRGVLVSYPADTSISAESFFNRILRRFDEPADFEGDYFFK